MQKRCSHCNRLLFIEIAGIKEIKVNNITYLLNGKIQVICKCNYKNKF